MPRLLRHQGVHAQQLHGVLQPDLELLPPLQHPRPRHQVRHLLALRLRCRSGLLLRHQPDRHRHARVAEEERRRSRPPLRGWVRVHLSGPPPRNHRRDAEPGRGRRFRRTPLANHYGAVRPRPFRALHQHKVGFTITRTAKATTTTTGTTATKATTVTTANHWQHTQDGDDREPPARLYNDALRSSPPGHHRTGGRYGCAAR